MFNTTLVHFGANVDLSNEPLPVVILVRSTYFIWRLVREFGLLYLILLFLFFMLPTVLGISSGVHDYYSRFLQRLFLYINTSFGDTEMSKEKEEWKRRVTEMYLHPPEKKKFEIVDLCTLITSATSAIVNDNVTQRFSSEELGWWNIMNRSRPGFIQLTWTLHVIWWVGFLFRYCILLPNRLLMTGITTVYIVGSGVFFAILPHKLISRNLSSYFTIIMSRLIISSLGINIRVHMKENIPTNGICVANHTTPLDGCVLSSVRFFRLVGQLQGGYFGMVQTVLAKVGHLFFERAHAFDRKDIYHALRKHAQNTKDPPIVLFPEGTCINNTSVMMFRKGSFEVSNIIYPVAIKYSSLYGDAFWNSMETSFGVYLLNIMSSWMVLCDVWFLPASERNEFESSIAFAARTRSNIAKQANLLELDWNGELKRSTLPKQYRFNIQAKYAATIIPPSTTLKRATNTFNNFNQFDKKKYHHEQFCRKLKRLSDTIDSVRTFTDDTFVNVRRYNNMSAHAKLLDRGSAKELPDND